MCHWVVRSTRKTPDCHATYHSGLIWMAFRATLREPTLTRAPNASAQLFDETPAPPTASGCGRVRAQVRKDSAMF